RVDTRAVGGTQLRLRAARRHWPVIALLVGVVAVALFAVLYHGATEGFRRKEIARFLEAARQDGKASSELRELVAALSVESLRASPEDVAFVESRVRSAVLRELSLAASDPAKRTPALLDQAVAAAVLAGHEACLVGEGDRPALGLAILERRELALDEGT